MSVKLDVVILVAAAAAGALGAVVPETVVLPDATPLALTTITG